MPPPHCRFMRTASIVRPPGSSTACFTAAPAWRGTATARACRGLAAIPPSMSRRPSPLAVEWQRDLSRGARPLFGDSWPRGRIRRRRRRDPALPGWPCHRASSRRGCGGRGARRRGRGPGRSPTCGGLGAARVPYGGIGVRSASVPRSHASVPRSPGSPRDAAHRSDGWSGRPTVPRRGGGVSRPCPLRCAEGRS